MANNSVKTKNFTRLDILRSLNAGFTIDQYSTLNEYFNIGHVDPPNSGYPTIKYLTIGRGGHKNTLGNNNLVDILEHSPTDATLFEPIPFVMVPIDNDLSVADRANYRIRTTVTLNGINYAQYWLKVIDTSNISPETRIITLQNGEIVADELYTPSQQNQHPTPVDISNVLVNVMEGKHLVIQAVLPVLLDNIEIAGIVDACTTIYGDARFATISEIGIVSGYDISITRNNITYTEVQTAQILTFMGTVENLQQNPSSITLQYALSNSLAYPAVV